MYFHEAFPWTLETWKRLQNAVKNQDGLIIRWWWGPYNQPALEALKYAAKFELNVDEFNRIIEDLSCPTAPKKFQKGMQIKGIAESDGRVPALDPILNMKQARSYLSGANFLDPKKGDIVLPTVSELKTILESNGKVWRPHVYGTREFEVVSTQLTKSSSALNSFQKMAAWSKLEVIERLYGNLYSWSELRFECIYKDAQE